MICIQNVVLPFQTQHCPLSPCRYGHNQCKSATRERNDGHHQCKGEGGMMDTISAREREERWTLSVQGRGRNDGHHQCKGEGGMMDTVSAREREE